MAEVLNVELRKADGKRVARRLRRGGAVPAILYGHGESNVSLTLKSEQLSGAVRHGSRVVELQGAANEKALIRDLQWDVYGLEILHVDFARVSEHERIKVDVHLSLRGESPGVKDGGIVEQFVHEVEVECEALSIPDKLYLVINDLKIGGSLTLGDVQLPAGVKLLCDPDQMAVHCIVPMEAEEAAPGEGATAEPEVIGRKAEEEAEERADCRSRGFSSWTLRSDGHETCRGPGKSRPQVSRHATQRGLSRAGCALAGRHAADKQKDGFQGEVAESGFGGDKILLLWPQTFMNLSGASVLAARDFYKLGDERRARRVRRLQSGAGQSCGCARRDRRAGRKDWKTSFAASGPKMFRGCGWASAARRQTAIRRILC